MQIRITIRIQEFLTEFATSVWGKLQIFWGISCLGGGLRSPSVSSLRKKRPQCGTCCWTVHVSLTNANEDIRSDGTSVRGVVICAQIRVIPYRLMTIRKYFQKMHISIVACSACPPVGCYTSNLSCTSTALDRPSKADQLNQGPTSTVFYSNVECSFA